MRNGTGRNNIVYGGSSSTNGQYLNRTATSLNSIRWLNISTSGTWNLLERTSTGRNNIRWNNLSFSFGTDLSKYSLFLRKYSGYGYYNCTIEFNQKYRYFYKIGSINFNTYSNISHIVSLNALLDYSSIIIFYEENDVKNAYNDIISNCTRFILKGNFDGIGSNKDFLFTESRYYIASSYSYITFKFNADFDDINTLSSITFS